MADERVRVVDRYVRREDGSTVRIRWINGKIVEVEPVEVEYVVPWMPKDEVLKEEIEPCMALVKIEPEVPRA